MFEKKIVSVIIPTYKRSEFLLKTIDSVLKQSYEPIEIIVVDDNGIGTDFQKATQERLQSLIDKGKILYIPHEVNKNGSAARNTGFKVSKGEYINFLDDDDELMPDKIERQVTTLENKDDSYGASYCNRKTIRRQNITGRLKTGCSSCMQEGDILYDYLFARCLISTSAILFKREAIEKLNGWDETYFRHQDLELMTRFFEHYKICPTSIEPLIIYDMSKDRGNVPNPERDYYIKEKYLSQFETLFERRGIKNEVMHRSWYLCAENAMLANDMEIYGKAQNKLKQYGALTQAERIRIYKKKIISFIVRMFK